MPKKQAKKKTEKPTPKTPEEEAEFEESGDVLRDMVSSLNELPTDVLEQLLKNLEAIEEYNKTHPNWEKEEEDDNPDGDGDK